MWPGRTISTAAGCTAGNDPRLARSSGNRLRCRPICCTTNNPAGISRGSPAMTICKASTPPREAPITMIAKSPKVLVQSPARRTGAPAGLPCTTHPADESATRESTKRHLCRFDADHPVITRRCEEENEGLLEFIAINRAGITAAFTRIWSALNLYATRPPVKLYGPRCRTIHVITAEDVCSTQRCRNLGEPSHESRVEDSKTRHLSLLHQVDGFEQKQPLCVDRQPHGALGAPTKRRALRLQSRAPAFRLT